MARACGSGKKPNPGPAPRPRPSRPFSPVERTPKLLKEGGTRQGHRGGATHAAPAGPPEAGRGPGPDARAMGGLPVSDAASHVFHGDDDEDLSRWPFAGASARRLRRERVR